MKIEVGAWLNFEQKDVTYDLCCLYIIEIDKPITWESPLPINLQET